MLAPDQFAVNEAWIAFRLSDAPVRTARDGDFHFVALMDAASGFILGAVPVAVAAGQPSTVETDELLAEARRHKDGWPHTLLLSAGLAADTLVDRAAAQGITVARVPEDQLLVFYGGARQAFREKFGTARPDGHG
ncbi:MAG: hypothetical protein JNM90_00770 [Burkholderiales bacterium]|nr:hypothetical protein [Burkholderiales bacterium]